LERIIQDFLEKVTKFNKEEKITLGDLSEHIRKASLNLGKEVLRTLLEKLDKEIKRSQQRKRKWYIERYDKRRINTSLGVIEFTRTYYVNKHKPKEYVYLLDQVLGINKYSRMDVSVEAKILEFANVLSYEKAGELFSEEMSFSKETVRNKIRKFGESEQKGNEEELKIKKKVKYLYIDADEDHVSLQNGKSKDNKIVYVYEGKVKESKNRNFLINKYVFGSPKESPEELWLRVLDYIYENYELDEIEKIYIQGDGANWIKTGVSWIDKSVHVIDMFHLNKAIMRLVGGNLKEGKGSELKKLIYSKDKENFLKISKELLELEQDEKRRERKRKALGYIKNQWSGIELFIDNKDKNKLGCSAEGHVSHVLASRMSSRPMGWSIEGLESLTKLRIFKENSGSVAEMQEILKKKNERIAIERKERLKNIKRLKKKVGETLGNIAAINIGKINGTYCSLKSLATR